MKWEYSSAAWNADRIGNIGPFCCIVSVRQPGFYYNISVGDTILEFGMRDREEEAFEAIDEWILKTIVTMIEESNAPIDLTGVI